MVTFYQVLMSSMSVSATYDLSALQ